MLRQKLGEIEKEIKSQNGGTADAVVSKTTGGTP